MSTSITELFNEFNQTNDLRHTIIANVVRQKLGILFFDTIQVKKKQTFVAGSGTLNASWRVVYRHRQIIVIFFYYKKREALTRLLCVDIQLRPQYFV